MKKEFLPGWCLMLALALIGRFIQGLVVVGGSKPVEAAIVAIIVGIVLRNLKLIPAIFDPGIKAFERPLIIGIILYGAALNFSQILAQGPRILATILITMVVAFLAIYYLGRAFRLPPKLAMLLGVGTTICGGSAIAVT
ncbi:unnamed protein product, partial [marine sediment metagenome]